jgi:hypothetical protein
MAVMQERVKRLTDIDSALRTLHACMILLSIRKLAVIASTIPYFKLFYGAAGNLQPLLAPGNVLSLLRTVSSRNCLCS